MSEFHIKPFIRSGNDVVDAYIFELEEYLTAFDASSIKRLISSLDSISAKLAEDIDSIIDGNTVDLIVLKDDKESKVFDRIMTLVSKVDQFKAVSDTAIALRPSIEEYKDPNKKTIKIDRNANVFEDIQEQMHKKYVGKKE